MTHSHGSIALAEEGGGGAVGRGWAKGRMKIFGEEKCIENPKL